jgi:S1-C subfamily serine protease
MKTSAALSALWRAAAAGMAALAGAGGWVALGSIFAAGALWATAATAAGPEQVLRRASIMVEAGRFKEAVAILKEVEPQTRDDDLALSVLTGKIYLAIDRPAKALEFFEDADAQALENFDAAIGAAHANLQLGRFAQARRYVQAARRVDQDSAEPDYVLAVIAHRTGNTAEAATQMQTLARTRPDSESVIVAYSKYLALVGDDAAARRALQDFANRAPAAAAIRDRLGDMEHQAGNAAHALRLKRVAADLYGSQGNTFKKEVLAAWLEANGGGAALPTPPSRPTAPPTSPPPAPATPQTVQEAAKAPPVPKPKPVAPAERDFATPLQRFPFPEGVVITGGSGFVVDGGTKVVTNRHVIEGGKAFAVRTGLGEMITAKVIFVSATDDLAVLSLDRPLNADRAIPSAAYVKPPVGRNVVVMGYPLWYVLGQGSPSLTNGMVSKRTGLGDDLGTFQLTAKVNKGNSGGPVFDMMGNVVGITVGKLDSKKIQDEQGFIPEDVNLAIHVDRLPAIANVRLTAQEPAGAELSTEALYQAMLGKVVMVATYK